MLAWINVVKMVVDARLKMLRNRPQNVNVVMALWGNSARQVMYRIFLLWETFNLNYLIYGNVPLWDLIVSDRDECANSSTNNCATIPNTDCTNTYGGFNCTCKSGFRRNGIQDPQALDLRDTANGCFGNVIHMECLLCYSTQ